MKVKLLCPSIQKRVMLPSLRGFQPHYLAPALDDVEKFLGLRGAIPLGWDANPRCGLGRVKGLWVQGSWLVSCWREGQSQTASTAAYDQTFVSLWREWWWGCTHPGLCLGWRTLGFCQAVAESHCPQLHNIVNECWFAFISFLHLLFKSHRDVCGFCQRAYFETATVEPLGSEVGREGRGLKQAQKVGLILVLQLRRKEIITHYNSFLTLHREVYCFPPCLRRAQVLISVWDRWSSRPSLASHAHDYFDACNTSWSSSKIVL